MKSSSGLLALACVLALAGCSGSTLTCGPGTQLSGDTCVASVVDAGTPAVDAGPRADAGPVDAGPADAGPQLDAGPVDAGPHPDSGPQLDAGPQTDAGPQGDAGPRVDSGPACVPQCVDRNCGDDGCGGQCGTCRSPATCNPIRGICTTQCVPNCNGIQCGDDGCGGQCGACDGGTCSSFGLCQPSAWTCASIAYGANHVCDCNCGAVDPDCSNASLPVSGCVSPQTCNAAGVCVGAVPSAWTCAAGSYGDGSVCNCGCGAVDPDCRVSNLQVAGCVGSPARCNADGACPACVPSCTGKTCGDDGCGGSCGSCSGTASYCDGTRCIDPCLPTPIACQSAVCGSDNCGGSCGDCEVNEVCDLGQCVLTGPVPDDSCRGRCGAAAPSGCGCAADCADGGACCNDYQARCVCVPSCTGKTCGDDGCGGSCGSCSGTTPYCSSGGQCTATCVPQCTGKTCGSDGCGGSCGSCGSGTACTSASQCVPTAWFCDPANYNAHDGCDCGCGAADPDCQPGSTTYGCPAGAACGSAGTCAVTFCSADTSCPNGACVGDYYEGSGRFGGVCQTGAVRGADEGQRCQASSECGAGFCLEGHCMDYCARDADCRTSALCAGLPIRASSASPAVGYASVCQHVDGTRIACAHQADCAATAESCVAVVDPSTLGPRYVCASSAGLSPTATTCSASACPDLQLCVTTAHGPVCTLPCPGGASDCPSGWSCGSTTLDNAGTPGLSTDDPTVPVCVPN